MGTLVQRSLSDGTLRYRAERRINRKNFPAYKESKTFTTKRIAEKWVKKREVEIENNPDILNGNHHEKSIKLSDAIDLYLNETEGVYSKTKVNALKLIQKFPIAKKSIMKLNIMDLSDHVALRKTYCPKVKVGSVVSTILHELLQIRSLLTHASVMVVMKFYSFLLEVCDLIECIEIVLKPVVDTFLFGMISFLS